MRRFFLFLLLCLPVPLWAASVWTYQAEGLGMTLLSGQLTLTEEQGKYTSLLETQSRGILSLLVDAKTQFFTTGRKTEHYVPISSYMVNTKNKTVKKRSVDLSVKEVQDYQTAMLNLASLEKPTDTTYLISDGRRVMRVRFVFTGTQEAEDVYAVFVKIVSGKKTGWFFEQMAKEESPLRIYLGTDEATGRKILKKATFKTGIFGTVVIYLVKGEVK